jgi:GT2 family glycosyltransferase
MIPVFGLLHYNGREMTRRCIESIDAPIEHFVLVLNGDHAFEDEVFELITDKAVNKLSIIKLENPGWAVAVNLILTAYPAPWWLICSNDMKFGAGDLHVARETRQMVGQPLIQLSNHGMGWFTVNAQALKKVGLFDVNLCPCYFEDCDWLRRAGLMGVQVHTLSVHSEHGLNGAISHTVNATPELKRENARTFEANKQYYIRKWGGEPGQETFDDPFNRPDYPLWAVSYDPEQRAGQQWRL